MECVASAHHQQPQIFKHLRLVWQLWTLQNIQESRLKPETWNTKRVSTSPRQSARSTGRTQIGRKQHRMNTEEVEKVSTQDAENYRNQECA